MALWRTARSAEGPTNAGPGGGRSGGLSFQTAGDGHSRSRQEVRDHAGLEWKAWHPPRRVPRGLVIATRLLSAQSKTS